MCVMNKKYVLLTFALFLNVATAECNAYYSISFDAATKAFIGEKAELFEMHQYSNYIKYVLNNKKRMLESILLLISNFTAHNDRDNMDCLELCYCLKVLEEKQINFYENEKLIIKKGIDIAVNYFMYRDYPDAASIGNAKIVFKNFNSDNIFCFKENICEKTSCLIL